MFRRCKNLKFATALLMLVTIAATGLVPVAPATVVCLEQDGVKPAVVCANSASCCCEPTAESRACGCRQNDDVPSPLPAVPNDSGRTLKWVARIDAPLGELVLAPPGRTNPLQRRSFSASFQRSLQTLLCVWRI